MLLSRKMRLEFYSITICLKTGNGIIGLNNELVLGLLI